MKVNIEQLIQEFNEKQIKNDRITPNGVENFLKEKINIKKYTTFEEKKQIANTIIATNIIKENGIKKVDSAGQFLGFVVAMFVAHTDLDFSEPIKSYDLLCEAELIEPIIALFNKDYLESEVILKMMVSDVLADNSLSVVVAKFLDGVLDKLDDFGDTIKGVIEKIDLDKLMGLGLNENEMAKVKSLLNKYVK